MLSREDAALDAQVLPVQGKYGIDTLKIDPFNCQPGYEQFYPAVGNRQIGGNRVRFGGTLDKPMFSLE